MMAGHGGTFDIRPFGYIERGARAGDFPRTWFLFEEVVGYGNGLDLYAERVRPSGEQLGNFPQAFTYLASTSTIHSLNRVLSTAHPDAAAQNGFSL